MCLAVSHHLSEMNTVNSSDERQNDSDPQDDSSADRQSVQMPNPTAAPMVMAFGLTIAASSVVMHVAFAVVGVLIAACGLVIWIRHLSPGAGVHLEAWVPENRRPRPVQVATKGVLSIKAGMPGHRLRVPAEIHPYSAGLKGGLIAGGMMAVTALLYGQFSGHGIWYPVNLLAAMVLPIQNFNEFDLTALIVGIVIHVVSSIIVGLFFGIILPMCPRWPLLWGGVVAPLLWSGFIYGFMGVLNPQMNDRVDWRWFFVSQFVFGLTIGFVVMRSEKVKIQQVLQEPPETGADQNSPNR